MKQKSAITILRGILVIIASIGLIDAGYLTVKHYQKTGVLCTISGSCEKVLNSDYSVIFGVPVAALGAFFYFTVLVIAVHMLLQKTHIKLLPIWATTGFVMTLYLLFLQAFVLEAWCQYCIFSAITSTTIFVLSWWLARLHKNSSSPRQSQTTNTRQDGQP